MTISQAIGKLRNDLENWDDDAVQYTDEYLYSLLNDAGAIVTSRITNRFNKIPEWMWSTFAVPLELANEDFFPCEDIEHCQILQSTYTLPEPLTGRNSSLFKVYVGSTEAIPYNVSNSYDPIFKGKPQYEIVNSYLRLYNVSKTLKGVKVKGIFADIMEWQDRHYCEQDAVVCYDLDSIQFPLYKNPEYTQMAFDLIFQRLNISVPPNIENQPN